MMKGLSAEDRIQVRELVWGAACDSELLGAFDVVVAATAPPVRVETCSGARVEEGVVGAAARGRVTATETTTRSAIRMRFAKSEEVATTRTREAFV